MAVGLIEEIVWLRVLVRAGWRAEDTWILRGMLVDDKIVFAGLLVVPIPFMIESSTLLLLQSGCQHLHHMLQVGDSSVGTLPPFPFLGRVVDTFSAGLGTALTFGIF